MFSDTEFLARLDVVEISFQSVFFQFVFYKAEGKPQPVDRYINFLEKIRNCADMIFVSVR